MVEDLKQTTRETISVQELVEDARPLPLVSPFVSGTPCLTPEGDEGTIESATLILEGPDGRGGTRRYIASHWEEARLQAKRGATLCPESTVRVRSRGRIRRFHAGEIRIVVRRDLASDDES